MDQLDSDELDITYSEIPLNANPGFFRRVYQSCRSLTFYRIPLNEPTRKAFWYFLKLVTLAALIVAINGILFTLPIVDGVSENLQNNLPRIVLQNGNLEVEGETPREISLYRDYRLLIDPEGIKNRMRLGDNILVVWVNGGLYYRAPGEAFWFMSTRTPQQANQTITINRNVIATWGPTIKVIVSVMLAAMSLIGTFLFNAVRVLIISAGGLFATQEFNTNLSFRDYIRVSCYGVTAPLLIDLLAQLVGWSPPFFEILLLCLGTFWVYLAIRANPIKLERTEPE